jgi:hypothetical protein
MVGGVLSAGFVTSASFGSAPPATDAQKNVKSAAAPALSADREKAALDFAREHHPELSDLVQKLRTENRRAYDKAIRDLTVARDRLNRLKKVAPQQYVLALAAWKLDSRANLLAARMTMSQDPVLESDLKAVLRERVDVRLQELHAEQSRLEDRLGKVKSIIQTIETDRNAVAARDLQRFKQTVAKNRRQPTKKTSANTKARPPQKPIPQKPVIVQRPKAPPKTPEQVVQPANKTQPTQ